MLGKLFLKTGRLTRDNLDTAKAALTYCILQAVADGERNCRRLAIRAVARADAVEPRIRLERSWSPAKAPGGLTGQDTWVFHAERPDAFCIGIV